MNLNSEISSYSIEQVTNTIVNKYLLFIYIKHLFVIYIVNKINSDFKAKHYDSVVFIDKSAFDKI